MAAPFTFIPRVVSKHAKEWPGIVSKSPPSLPLPIAPTIDSDSEFDGDDENDSTPPSGKGKEKTNEPTHSKYSTITRDIASLISLAISDYNIWLDSDLRWKLDACLCDETSSDEAGFIPINYLLRRAPFRGSLQLGDGQPEPSETEVVKALRMHATHVLEVRMRLPISSSSSASFSPTSTVWYGTGKTSRKRDVGGYEVRRRDWPTLRHRPSRGWARTRWDDTTAYLEGLPPQYRTVGSVAYLAETLLSQILGPDMGLDSRIRVQNVSLPPHYLDKPGDIPKCKGYALITFSTKSHLEAILRAWPWKRQRVLSLSNMDGDRDAFVVKEAQKYGLRMIPKARWDALNEEYRLYKQYLVNEIARTQTEVQQSSESVAVAVTEPELHELETPTCMQTMSASPYPFNCLVFVRNVHPETIKTTLKSLFSQAFQVQDDSDRGRAPWGLDYVDFTKGMDTCYLRLSSPHRATRLMAYFGGEQKAQADGLDATGRMPIGNDKPITMELIQGKKEKLYWDRVPQKVRLQAVNKVVNAQRTIVAGPMLPAAHRNCAQENCHKKRPMES